MPECGEMEALLGVAIARMESAKRELLTVFDDAYPQMITDEVRSSWSSALVMAQLQVERAERGIADTFKSITGNELPAHPRITDLPLQDQPTTEKAACTECVARDKILAEAKLALELTARFLKSLAALDPNPATLQFLTLVNGAAQKIPGPSAERIGPTLDPNIKEPS